MIEISEPLPESEFGLTTMRDIFSDGKRVGYVEKTYLQEDNVKTFKKHTKRKLFVGQPYGTRIFIDARETRVAASELGKNGLSEIVVAVKEKVKGLEDRDIYLSELTDAGKKIVCKASEL